MIESAKSSMMKGGKRLASLLGKLFLNPIGLFFIFVFCLISLVILITVSIFGEVSSGNLDGSGDEDSNKTLKQEYVEVAESAFPGVKTETAEELKYKLEWGLIYSIDFYSAETHDGDIEEMPYNDINQLANDLNTHFEYETSVITITTEREVEIEKENEDGEIEIETEIETETEEKEVKLLKHVDTVKGNYTYYYEHLK